MKLNKISVAELVGSKSNSMKITIEGYYGEIFYPTILEKNNTLSFYPSEDVNPDDLVAVPLPEWLIEAIRISKSNAILLHDLYEKTSRNNG